MLLAVLAGFLATPAAPWAHRLAPRYSAWLLALVPAALTAYFLTLLPRAAEGDPLTVSYPWVPAMGINLSFYADGLALLFALLIAGIGTLVVIYTGGYLRDHPRQGWFIAYTLMFMGSMLGVVLSSNLITLFVFWELTSVSSYLLIGFDQERAQARAAAWQALLVTAFGGLALLAGLVLMGVAGGTYELTELLAGGAAITEHSLYLPILLLVLLGAFTKSAQFPFHFWLPNAMEAPTPASAYLHSSTMVKAGIYLLARFNPVLGGTSSWFYLLMLFGGATMVLGACMALPQTYLKRLLAYTTVSALGAIIMLIGVGTEAAVHAAMVFLLVHALYKGALFLVAGAIDHEAGEKDVTRLGGLWRTMPITGIAALLAGLSMAGIPPLFGFIGKELMYEAALATPLWAWLIALAALATNIIMVAVAIMLVWNPFLSRWQVTPKEPHEAPLSMWLGPALLAGLGLFIGVAPGAAQSLILSPAAWSLDPGVEAIKLVLWHGFNLPLLLSVITLAGGIAVYFQRERVLERAKPVTQYSPWGPGAGYDGLLNGTLRFAAWQTRVLQSGYLRMYLLFTVITTMVLVVYALATRWRVFPEFVLSEVTLYEAMAALLVALAAVYAVWTSSRLAAVAALGVAGYAMAVIFVMYGAPDLAMTQFVIETLTVILFLLVFYHLSPYAIYGGAAPRVRDGAIAIGLGALMSVLVLLATQIQYEPSISHFFVERSLPDAHGRNFVNVILVDFRAMDTLAEVVVLAVAGLGAYSLLRLRAARKESSE